MTTTDRKYGDLTRDELKSNVRVLHKCGLSAIATCFDDLLSHIEELTQTVRDRDAELLRIRTTETASAHALDRIRQYMNLDAGTHPSNIAGIVEKEVGRLKAKVDDERLQTLYSEFYSGAHLIDDAKDKLFGWYDSCAKSHVRDAGDELVELGRMERHPNGYGRRWFYREIKKETP